MIASGLEWNFFLPNHIKVDEIRNDLVISNTISDIIKKKDWSGSIMVFAKTMPVVNNSYKNYFNKKRLGGWPSKWCCVWPNKKRHKITTANSGKSGKR